MQENKRIYLSPPHMSGDEIDYVMEAFQTNWIAPLGPHVNSFEKELSDYFGNRVYACALHSGTAALHLALRNLNLKEGDEVLVSTLTFVASVNPILYENAIPVFVDSEIETWNMNPNILEYAIEDRIRNGKKPAAIIVVHIYGMPAKIDKILEISNKYEIPVIEDAAEALGSKFKNELIGTFGVIAALSFNGNKIITTSGGGALLSSDFKYVEQARFLATQARDNYPYYHHSTLGYNYRLSNVLAAIGRGQLKVLDLRIVQKRTIFKKYTEFFSRYDGISWVKEQSDFFSNRWLTTILIDEEKISKNPADLISFLERYNIEARHIWKPMHLQPIFNNYPAYLDGTSDKIFKKGICLPSGTAMSDNDLHRIFDLLDNFFS